MFSFIPKFFAAITIGISSLFGAHSAAPVLNTPAATSTPVAAQVPKTPVAPLKTVPAPVQMQNNATPPKQVFVTSGPETQQQMPANTVTEGIRVVLIAQSAGRTLALVPGVPSSDHFILEFSFKPGREVYIPLTIGNASTTAGIDYVIEGAASTSKATIACDQPIVTAGLQYCHVGAASSTVMTAAVSLPQNSNKYAIQIDAIRYRTSLAASELSVYEPVGLITSSY